jgi:hypothetical protein
VVDNAAKQVPSGGSPDPGSTDLLRRAKNVERQFAYFGLVVRKCSFDDAIPSAERAGFTLVASNAADREALLEWSEEPDFLFSLAFEDPAIIWIVAESRDDIYGLNLVSHSGIVEVSVELKPWLGIDQLGRNALKFRDILLSFPQFVETPAWASASASFPGTR